MLCTYLKIFEKVRFLPSYEKNFENYLIVVFLVVLKMWQEQFSCLQNETLKKTFVILFQTQKIIAIHKSIKLDVKVLIPYIYIYYNKDKLLLREIFLNIK